MANLIERNDVINYLRNEVSLGTFMTRTIEKADKACCSICNGIITKVPRVDAEPVRHGKWVHLGGDEWCCSACGEIEHTEGSWEHPLKDREWKYCRTCGARMDLDDA